MPATKTPIINITTETSIKENAVRGRICLFINCEFPEFKFYEKTKSKTSTIKQESKNYFFWRVNFIGVRIKQCHLTVDKPNLANIFRRLFPPFPF